MPQLTASCPALGEDGTIYVSPGYPSLNANLLAITPQGAFKWHWVSLSAGEVNGSCAVGSDGTVYLKSSANENVLYAISPSGTERWQVSLGAPVGPFGDGCSPAIGSDGTIYVCSGNSTTNGLYAFSPDGHLKWVFQTAGPAMFNPSIGPDGTVYFNDLETVNSQSGEVLRAINPNGTERWYYISDGTAVGDPVVDADGMVYQDAEYPNSTGLALDAINPFGANLWTVSLGGTDFYDSLPVIASDGTIVVHGDSGYPLTLLAPNGTKVGTLPLPPSAPYESIDLSSDGLIYYTSTNRVDAIDFSGTIRWTFPLPARPYGGPPTIGSDGTVYICCSDTNLYAIKGTAPLAQSAWPKFRGNTRNTGNVAENLNPHYSVPPPVVLGLGAVGGTVSPQAFCAEPVSTGNGNYFYHRADFVMPGKGMPLKFERSYNSLDDYSGPLCANWTHSYNIFLVSTPEGAVIKWGDGHTETYTLNGDAYTPQPGVFNTLVKNADGSFLLMRKDQTVYAFSPQGKLMSIEDRNGNTITLTYDPSGNLTKITDTVGRVLSLTYDSNNRISRVTDPIGRTTAFEYDTAGNLLKATDPAGGATVFTYDTNHRLLTVTLPNGNLLLTNTYDSSGRVATQANGRGFATSFNYDTPNPGETTITDPSGNQTIHTYDQLLRIVKITDALGGVIAYAYDDNNDRTRVTNQRGLTTTFTYDSRGNLLTATDPLGNTSRFTYDQQNNLLSATTPSAHTTTLSYDARGNLITIKDALSNVTSFTHDPSGLLTSKTDPRGNKTTYGYDTSANLVTVKDAMGDTTRLGYDGIGRLTSITDADGHTSTASYDALSRLTNATDPLGDQTALAYDPVGNLLRVTDAGGNAISYAYDEVNNLIRVTDASGNITAYSYDANNKRIGFTNAKGAITKYSYDALNRLVGVTDPLGFVTTYGYDPTGDVSATKDADGNLNQFSYDADNRLERILYADNRRVTYAYDADGYRKSITDWTGTTTYGYDTIGRILSVGRPGGVIVKYSYNAVGKRSSLTYPDGKVLQYAYDKDNRLSAITDWLSRTTTYGYDPAGNVVGWIYPNETAVEVTYDAANRLVKVQNGYRGSTDFPLNPVTSFTYALDAVGNRLSVTDGSGKVTSYRYDDRYELTSAATGDKVTRYTYDSVGNRLTMTAPGVSVNYSYDADDRLLSAGGTTFTYDANGNEVKEMFGGATLHYGYDAANRLVSLSGGGINDSFSYDGDGNRITQRVGAGTYSYVNDVAAALPVVLRESGPDGDITYARGFNLVSESSTKFDFFDLYDGLGSIVGLTQPNGKLAGRYTYDAWGEPVLTAPAPKLRTKNKFRFTGEAFDPESGLYYLRARYYDPELGRFISRDPFPGIVARPLSANKFSYVMNNPIRFSDPRGLCAETQRPFVDLGPLNPTMSMSTPSTVINLVGAGKRIDSLKVGADVVDVIHDVVSILEILGNGTVDPYFFIIPKSAFPIFANPTKT